MTLNYTDQGNEKEPCIILVHAFPLDHSMWRYQLDDLSDLAHLYSPDIPGFGESPLLETEATINSYVEQFKTFTKNKNIKKAIWVGCSLGGYILFELWRNEPELVSGLIFCDTRAEEDSEQARSNRMESIQSVQINGTGNLANTMPAKLLGKTTQETRKDIVEEAVQIIRATEPQAVIHAQQAMAQRVDSVQTLSTITVPTLVIVGDEDTLTPPDVAQVIMDGIPNAQMQIIPKAGHLSPWEQPEHVNRAIRQFLEDNQFKQE